MQIKPDAAKPAPVDQIWIVTTALGAVPCYRNRSPKGATTLHATGLILGRHLSFGVPSETAAKIQALPCSAGGDASPS